MAFAKKSLQVTFVLASGTFTGTNSDTLLLPPGPNKLGLRMQVQVNNAGALSGAALNLTIFGMTLSQMNDLSTLGLKVQLQPRNLVIVQALTDTNSWATVFLGNVINAYADFMAMPDVSFKVDATSYGGYNTQQASPTSYDGSADIGSSGGPLANLASQSGLQFESNGVSVPIRNLYLYGSVGDQIKDCCEAAGVGYTIDNGTLAIWPKNGARAGAVPLISPATGLAKAPGYWQSGIILETYYNPAIRFQGQIRVDSALLGSVPAAKVKAAGLLPANGIWNVSELDHDLESGVPHGSWFSTVWAYNSDFVNAAAAAASRGFQG